MLASSSAYGREAGNAMLKYLPRGGFYITGGLAPKNLDFFTKNPIFKQQMFDKGRVSPAIEAIPVYLVLTEDLGERGAHYYAYQLLQTYKQSLLTNRDVDVSGISEGKYGAIAQAALLSAFAAAGVAIGSALARTN
jgi:glucokinase